MRIRFYIKSSKLKETTIYYQVSHIGQIKRLTTGLKVDVMFWDNKKKTIKHIPKYSKLSTQYKDYLDAIVQNYNSIHTDLIKEHGKRYPIEVLIERYKVKIELDQTKIKDFKSIWEEFIKEKTKTISKGTIKRHQLLYRSLIEYNPNFNLKFIN